MDFKKEHNQYRFKYDKVLVEFFKNTIKKTVAMDKRSMDMTKLKRPSNKNHDLSFLQEDKKTAAISKPNKRHAFWSLFRKNKVAYLLILIIFFAAGLYLSPIIFEKSDVLAIPVETESLFKENTYYKISLKSGNIYYALVKEGDSEHYVLNQVFYKIEEGKVDSEETRKLGLEDEEAKENISKIILASLSDDEDKPLGGLILPREDVESLAPLSESSSVIVAIDQYLSNIQTEN